MKFFRPASVTYVCIGVLVTLAIVGAGLGVTIHFADIYSGRTRRGLKKLANHASNWLTNTTIATPSISQNVVVPSQIIHTNVDISQLTVPIIEAFQNTPFASVPVLNQTLPLTIATPDIIVPVTISGISLSLMAIFGEEIINNIIDTLNSAPEVGSKVVNYSILSFGIIMTLLLANVVIDKVLYGGMGLWLKADIANKADKSRSAPSP